MKLEHQAGCRPSGDQVSNALAPMSPCNGVEHWQHIDLESLDQCNAEASRWRWGDEPVMHVAFELYMRTTSLRFRCLLTGAYSSCKRYLWVWRLLVCWDFCAGGGMYDDVGLLCCLLSPEMSDSASLLQLVLVIVAYHQSGCVPKVCRPGFRPWLLFRQNQLLMCKTPRSEVNWVLTYISMGRGSDAPFMVQQGERVAQERHDGELE